MNGVHDMGGMQDMGPIELEKNEPVFPERWQATAFALNLASFGLFPKGVSPRFAIEQIPPADYLRMSYYEKWVESLQNILLHAGILKPEEIASGKPAPGSPKAKPAFIAAKVQELIYGDDSGRLNVEVQPRFHTGNQVRSRNMNPAGHTRLPRYARGRAGTIVRDHGVWAFEDTGDDGLQINKPQHLYSVRFSARELWGDQASAQDAVYLDLWDDYLEHAHA
jgi:nitrile hydratase beta subunit